MLTFFKNWTTLPGMHWQKYINHFVGNDSVKRYQKNIVSFVAYNHAEKKPLDDLDGLTGVDETFFIIGNLPPLSPGYNIETRLSCVQMVCLKLTNLPSFTVVIEDLLQNDGTTNAGAHQPGAARLLFARYKNDG